MEQMIDERPDLKVGNQTKLTEWEKEPTLEDLKADLEESKPFHAEHISDLNRWDDHFHAKGTGAVQHPAGVTNRSKVVPRLIRKQAEWRYAALSEPFLSNEALFSITPVSFEDRKSANQNSIILNNQFQTKIDKVNFIDSYVREMVDCGTAILRTSWVYEEIEIEEAVPKYVYEPAAPDQVEMIQQMIELELSNPTEFFNLAQEMIESVRMTKISQVPVIAIVSDWEMQKVTKIVKNHPFVEVCDQRNTYVDPTCMGDIDKASFVVHGYESTLSDLKRAGIYSNLEKIDVNSPRPTSNDDDQTRINTASNFTFKDKARKKLFVYEYWGFRDITGTGVTVPIVAAWVDSVLIRMSEVPYPDKKLPFVLVKYLPKRNSVYGEPDGELLIENQKIMGAVMRGMIDTFGRSANGQMGIVKNALDSTNLIRFRNGENYEFNPQFNPQTGIYMHTFPEIPASANYMLQLQNNDAESLTGVKSFAGNGLSASALGNSGSSAASVRGVLDAASKREMSILRRLVEGLLKVARKFISMNAEFLSEKEVVRITNEKFVTINRDDLAGNFDLKINVSTPEAEEAKAQELAFMLQTMGNSLDGQMVKLILSEISRLRKMPDLARMIEQFEPQPDPLAEAERQADIEIKQAQAALYRAQAEEAMAKSILNATKVPVEQARADNLQSNADATKISAANKDSGIDHLREMERTATKGVADMEKQVFAHNSAIAQKAMDFETGSFNQEPSM